MLQEFLEIEELKSIHEEKLRLMEREMALSFTNRIGVYTHAV